MKVSISDEVFEVTDEQLEEIKEIIKPKFEKIKRCHLGIETTRDGRVKLTWAGSPDSNYCLETPDRIRTTIEDLQSAIDFIESK